MIGCECGALAHDGPHEFALFIESMREDQLDEYIETSKERIAALEDVLSARGSRVGNGFQVQNVESKTPQDL